MVYAYLVIKPNTFGDKYKKIDDNTYIEIGKPNKKYTWDQMQDKKISLDNFSYKFQNLVNIIKKYLLIMIFQVNHVFKNGKINKLDLNIKNYPKKIIIF